MESRTKFIIEARDDKGQLDFDLEREKRLEHPYLFSRGSFTLDNLCYYMSFGQKRDNPSEPMQLDEFMQSIGLTYRQKTW